MVVGGSLSVGLGFGSVGLGPSRTPESGLVPCKLALVVRFLWRREQAKGGFAVGAQYTRLWAPCANRNCHFHGQQAPSSCLLTGASTCQPVVWSYCVWLPCCAIRTS